MGEQRKKKKDRNPKCDKRKECRREGEREGEREASEVQNV